MSVDDENSNSLAVIRICVLALVCIQTAGHSIATSYSRGILKEHYSSVEVIVAAELIKLMCSGALTVLQHGGKRSTTQSTVTPIQHCHRLLTLLWNGKKVVVLVVLYSISNMLPFYSVPRIGAPVFTVCIQLKIFTTAAFATLILGRQYSATKWRALLLLVVGCILVASPIINKPPEAESNPSLTVDRMESLMGLLATLLQATISGFSAVYFEALLKDKDDTTTIWERNFQLAFYSIFLLALYQASMLLSTLQTQKDPTANDSGWHSGMLEGWSWVTVAVVLLQGAGGMLVAATLKYADAVLKCFATAVSIIIVSVAGYFFLGNDIDMFVAIGMLVTVISIFNYTLDHQATTTPS